MVYTLISLKYVLRNGIIGSAIKSVYVGIYLVLVNNFPKWLNQFTLPTRRSESSSCFTSSSFLVDGEEEILTEKEHKETFWGDGNILFTNLVSGYLGVYLM